MRTRWLLLGSVVALPAFVFGACGARTELPLADDVATQAGGGEGGGGEGGGGQGEGGEPQGGRLDGGGGEGVGGAPPPDCVPETTQYIYLVTDEAGLYAYNPASGFFEQRGVLDCPNLNGATPFSMGVDRQGIAYVVYNDGNLYRVSTLDAACEETEFEPFSQMEPFHVFGMGFALDEVGGETDRLYVADITFTLPSAGLATIDTETLELDFIGPFSSNPGNAIEMTSSSDGNLYGFFLDVNGAGGWVVEIDKTSGTVLSETFVAAGNGGGALAFAWWSGDFYVFTAPGGGDTTVTRYDPDSGEVGVHTTFGGLSVVGAGVSTCAPGQLP